MSTNSINTNMDRSLAELEQKVAELTEALNTKDQRLNEALTELQRLQSHLLQMEKMSMLGQMVSGISHEINNPINFIYGNLPYVEEHVGDLFTVLETYDEAYPEKTEDVESVLEDVELDYILDDLPRIVNSMKVGAERIRELVLNLRNFYRMDEAEMKPGDLMAGIESTLILLNNRYKRDIEIVRQFEKIPMVECHINQINQVFMNLISNAIDALLDKHWIDEHSEEEVEEKGPKKKKQIVITTKQLEKERVSITIADNGPGIPLENQVKVFESFFTTKPIGAGTGLGLSISRQIVEETHGGKIFCTSTLGEGTTFTVELPIAQPEH